MKLKNFFLAKHAPAAQPSHNEPPTLNTGIDRLSQLMAVDSEHIFLAAVKANGTLPALALTTKEMRRNCKSFVHRRLYPDFSRAMDQCISLHESQNGTTQDLAACLINGQVPIMAEGLRSLSKMRVALRQTADLSTAYRSTKPQEVKGDVVLFETAWKNFLSDNQHPPAGLDLSTRLDKIQRYLLETYSNSFKGELRIASSLYTLDRYLWGVRLTDSLLSASRSDAGTFRLDGRWANWANHEDVLVQHTLQLLPKLTTLIFVDNVPQRVWTLLAPFQKITALHIDAPWAESAPLDALPQLRTLTWRQVSGHILPFTLNEDCKLQTLSLEGTRGPFPSQLPQLRHMPDLQFLTITGTAMDIFPEEILQLYKLEALNLRFNRLTDLPQTMSGLTRLRHMDVSANSLQSISLCLLELPSLEIVHLYNNSIEAWPRELNVLLDVKALGMGKFFARRYPSLMAECKGSKIGSMSGNPIHNIYLPHSTTISLGILILVAASVKLHEKRQRKTAV